MLTFNHDDFKHQIEEDTGIKPTWAGLDQDVRQSLARTTAGPFIAKKDQIRGFVHDVDTGRLREVGRGRERPRPNRPFARHRATGRSPD